MSSDSSIALLVAGRDARPGAGSFIDAWDPATGKINSMRALGELYSPALLPDGRSVAFSTKTGEKCVVWICDLASNSKPVPIFPTTDQDEVSAAPFVIHAFPLPSDRLLFYAPGGTNVFTIRRNGDGLRRYALPDHVSSPVMVQIADDNFATLTMPQISAEKIAFQAYRLDFTAKKFTPIDDPGPTLLGGHIADPRSYHHTAAPRYAWLSPAGMALGEGGKARYFPTTAAEYLAASAFQLKQGVADKALASVEKAREFTNGPDDPGELDRAESRASLAVKQYERASEVYEHALLHYPIGADGLRFLFPASSGLPRPNPTAVATQLKEMDDLIKATPANQKLPLLRQALALRMDGKQAQALDIYPKVIPFCADQSQVAGLRFQEALCQFEAGDLAVAGEKFESAARVTEFPQSQYAAGLAAIVYILDAPHADVVPKAAAALALPSAKTGPLSAEAARAVKQNLNQRQVLPRTREECGEQGAGRSRVGVGRVRSLLHSLRDVEAAACVPGEGRQAGRSPHRRPPGYGLCDLAEQRRAGSDLPGSVRDQRSDRGARRQARGIHGHWRCLSAGASRMRSLRRRRSWRNGDGRRAGGSHRAVVPAAIGVGLKLDGCERTEDRRNGRRCLRRRNGVQQESARSSGASPAEAVVRGLCARTGLLGGQRRPPHPLSVDLLESTAGAGRFVRFHALLALEANLRVGLRREGAVEHVADDDDSDCGDDEDSDRITDLIGRIGEREHEIILPRILIT